MTKSLEVLKLEQEIEKYEVMARGWHFEASNWKAKAETWEEAFKFLVANQGQTKRNHYFKPKDPVVISLTPTEIIKQEKEASDIVDNIILPKVKETPPQEGEVGVQFSWVATVGEFILNQIKQQAPIVIAKVLEEIKEKSVPYAIELIEWLMIRLQDWLYSCWENLHTEEEKQTLKDRIIDKFPESQLAERLRNS